MTTTKLYFKLNVSFKTIIKVGRVDKIEMKNKNEGKINNQKN